MASLSVSAVGLSASQRAMVDVIEQVLGARGYPRPLIAAAVTNAYAESGLNPNAVGDSGHSVGFFQLNDRGGGAGMSVADRKDPRLNTARIADEYERTNLPKLVAAGETNIAKLAALWSTLVERPADKAGEAARRAATALRLFPGQVVTAVQHEEARVAASPWTKPVLEAGAVVVGGLLLIGFLRRARRA